MKSQNHQKKSAAFIQAAAVAAAWTIGQGIAQAGTSTNSSGSPVQQGAGNPAVTISFSGQTALRTFNTSGALTVLQPGTGTFILHNGLGGAAVIYSAPNTPSTNVQFANADFTSGDVNPGSPTSASTASLQLASAIRLEWHEQGSIDGFYDLINDQIGYVQVSQGGNGPISNAALRGPSSSNPTWVNTNKFTGAGPINGFALSATGYADTYNSTTYTLATGKNLLGGQDRIQFAVGEYPTEAAAVTGTASVIAKAGAPGYGQGNPALRSAATLTALGVGGTKQQFQPTTSLNLSIDKIDPQTGVAYAAGPWNSAGAANITSTNIGVTAVTISANPGTGLSRLNLGDSQWLQTTGRLQNGALFNVVARTVDTGQRVVVALNTGIDPSWAVGSNDNGNSTSTTAANAQHSIGPSLRFDGKTSGTEAEKTVAQSRMSLGALSVPEVRAAASNAPVRALDIDFNDLTDPTTGGSTDASKFVRANFDSIVSSDPATHYAATLISHYNSVKTPNQTALNNELTAEGINPATATSAQQLAAWSNVQSFDPATAESDSTPASAPISGIKGDTTGDVAAFISNIANSVATASTGVNNPTSANNPADGLLSTGFLLPGLLNWTRQADGDPITPVTLSAAALAQQQQAKGNYGTLFTTDLTAGSNGQTIGNSATYGAGNTGAAAINGAIPITAKNANGSAAGNGSVVPGGNYLFGNFNQNGVRDYSAVLQSLNAALSLHHADGALNSIFTPDSGVSNSTVVPSLSGTPGWVTTGTNTKGDLITLGDFNGDGRFDGQDLYLLAIGASLADNTSSSTLTATATSFADAVRNPNAVLRKNAALDSFNNLLNNSANADQLFIRQSGRAVLTGITVPAGATDLHTTDPITGAEQFTYDPNGVYAFDKHDVNRDGVVDLNDALLVDQYNGQSYKNLSQSLAAVAPTPVSGLTQALSLVVAQQIDGEATIGSADVAEINTGLTGSGATNWYGYAAQKTGPGTIAFARTGGTVTVYSGALLTISSGTLVAGGTVDPFTDNSGLATNGTHLTIVNNAGLQITAGTKNLNALTGTGNTSISAGATLIAANIRQSTLAVSGNALIRANGSNTGVSVVNSLSVSGAGRFDLNNNDLIVTYTGGTPASTIRGYLQSGFNVGNWNGVGLASFAAHNNPDYTTGLGYAEASDVSPGAFDGVTLTGNAILVKYTYYGDSNLDGSVTAADFTRFLDGLAGNGSTWAQGDYTYDGVVDLGNDFNLFLTNFITQGGALGDLRPAVLTDGSLTASQRAQLLSVVPEPSSAAIASLVAGALTLRRRRK